MASADYVQQTYKGIKKSFDNSSNIILERLKSIPCFKVTTTSEWTEEYTSTEGFTGARKLSEHETPDVNKLQDGFKVSFSPNRYGNAIETTSTDREKMEDNTMKVKEFIERQRDGLLFNINNVLVDDIHRFLNEAFDSTSDLVAPDGAEICGAHTWVSGTTFNNKKTSKLDMAALDAANEYAASFKDSAGVEMPLNFNTVVVCKGSENARNAKKLLAEGINPTAVGDINIYEGAYKIVETPKIKWDNRDYWFMMDTTIAESPLYMGITKAPTLTEPIRAENEAIRQNVEAFWKTGVINMPYQILGMDWTA